MAGFVLFTNKGSILGRTKNRPINQIIKAYTAPHSVTTTPGNLVISMPNIVPKTADTMK